MIRRRNMLGTATRVFICVTILAISASCSSIVSVDDECNVDSDCLSRGTNLRCESHLCVPIKGQDPSANDAGTDINADPTTNTDGTDVIAGAVTDTVADTGTDVPTDTDMEMYTGTLLSKTEPINTRKRPSFPRRRESMKPAT